jgi:hypothetical protein
MRVLTTVPSVDANGTTLTRAQASCWACPQYRYAHEGACRHAQASCWVLCSAAGCVQASCRAGGWALLGGASCSVANVRAWRVAVVLDQVFLGLAWWPNSTPRRQRTMAPLPQRPSAQYPGRAQHGAVEWTAALRARRRQQRAPARQLEGPKRPTRCLEPARRPAGCSRRRSGWRSGRRSGHGSRGHQTLLMASHARGAPRWAPSSVGGGTGGRLPAELDSAAGELRAPGPPRAVLSTARAVLGPPRAVSGPRLRTAPLAPDDAGGRGARRGAWARQLARVSSGVRRGEGRQLARLELRLDSAGGEEAAAEAAERGDEG